MSFIGGRFAFKWPQFNALGRGIDVAMRTRRASIAGRQEVLMARHSLRSDTAAWRFQTWASFILALGATSLGVAALPGNIWLKAFLGLGLWFTVSSSFALAKALRDSHEAEKLTNKIEDAKTEQILREVARDPLYSVNG